jgi:pimeloyl-ACP methyl ester carboxylesterase
MKQIIYITLTIIAISLFACQKESITLGTNANDTFFLNNKGVSMPIQVCGNLANKKILLIVHGGPGNSAIFYRTDYVKNTVEKEFAIVYWDQRLAGASQGNATNTNIELFKEDLKKVVQLIESRYGNDKQLYLMGHSWGGFLAPYFLIDGNNQDLINGWIQVDGVHNYSLHDSLTKEMLLFYGKNEIGLKKNTDKWQPIVDYCNAHAFNENFVVAEQLNSYANEADKYLDEVNVGTDIISALKTASGNGFSISAYLSNQYTTIKRQIDHQAYSISLSANLYKIKLPTLLLWGKYDFVCPTGLMEEVNKNISSADITKNIFEKSGHAPMFNEKEAFWSSVITWVKVH